MWHRALAECKKARESEHPDALKIVQNFGMLYHSRGEFDIAETMLNRVLAGYGKTLEPDNPDMLMVFHCLGLLNYSRGKLDKTKTMFNRVLAEYDRRWSQSIQTRSKLSRNLESSILSAKSMIKPKQCSNRHY